MIKIRPIDEELNSLHEPLAVTVSEDDIDSALDGFRVTNSGSVMIPSGLTKPYIERATNVANSGSMFHQPGPQVHQDQHFQHHQHNQHMHQLLQQQQHQQQQQQDYFYQQQYHQQLLQMQQQQFQQGYYSNSLPRSFSHHSAGYHKAMPSSLPASLPQYFSHQPYHAPQHLPHPGVSPLGMSPMGVAYSPMVHHQQPQQFSQGYNYPQHPYPYPNAW